MRSIFRLVPPSKKNVLRQWIETWSGHRLRGRCMWPSRHAWDTFKHTTFLWNLVKLPAKHESYAFIGVVVKSPWKWVLNTKHWSRSYPGFNVSNKTKCRQKNAMHVVSGLKSRRCWWKVRIDHHVAANSRLSTCFFFGMEKICSGRML